MKASTALAILSALGGVEAFWRMECHGQVGLARVDPIVDPGRQAHHVHAIHGSSGFSETSSYEDLMNADCTSCAVRQDKSVYWAPAMYFQHDNGTYEAVDQAGGMLAYYFLNKDDRNPDKGIKSFPAGFQMIAGDTTRRNYTITGQSPTDKDPEKSMWASLGQTSQKDLQQRAIGFNCLDYDKDPEGALYRHYMPDKAYLDANCKSGLRIELMFPSCWNGKDLDSPNHRDHVAYPDLVMTGACPKGFEVKFAGLFFETIWNTQMFKGIPGQFVLSNGDVHGFGYHGDFMMGWDVDFLQDAINTCTNPSGRIQDCAIFDIQTEDEERQCKMNKMPRILAAEKVTGVIGNTLPGGVQIAYGPEPAIGKPQAAPPSPKTSVPVPTATYEKATETLPGQVFQEATSSSDEINALAVPATTPAPSETPVDDGKYSIVRTDYVTEGNVVNMIIVKEAVEYVTVTTTTVVPLGSPAAAKERREAHVHRHGRRHHH